MLTNRGSRSWQQPMLTTAVACALVDARKPEFPRGYEHIAAEGPP